MESVAGQFEKISSIALRCKKGTFLASFPCKDLSATQEISKAKENLMVTADAKLLVAIDSALVEVYELPSQQPAYSATFANIFASSLSPCQKFLVVMDFIGQENYRLYVLQVPTLARVKEFAFKHFSLEKWPILSFAKGDSMALMAQKTEIIVMETVGFSILRKLPFGDVDYLSMAESSEGLMLLAASFEKAKGFEKTPSHLTLLSDSDFDKPLYSDELDRAEDLKAYFSPDGCNLIVMMQTFHDETGKSYYGQSTLYIFKKGATSFKKIPTTEGPIHDISWSPDSQHFIIISGFMPAKTVLFDSKVNAVFEFGTHYRNMVKWNPFSRFVVLAGFGNLNGEMEVWDIKTLQIIGKGKSECAIKLDWAKDGRHFLTGVLNPRLRVNNNYKVSSFF